MDDDQTPISASDAEHIPVLLGRVLELLGPALAGHPAVAVDATLGLGGHTEALLEQHPQLRVVGLDRDYDALARSRQRLARFGDRVAFVHAVYDRLAEVLASLDIERVDGVLFDLGVSSLQLDVVERGFAYSRSAPLDMRMDATASLTAAQIVNGYSVRELTRILRDYGEERFAARVAAAIVAARARRPFTTTDQLADLVRDSIPAATRRHGGHPAKRTFQALRIEVNGELEVLERAVPAALAAVRVGGRVVAMSFQSLEDRIVKRTFAALATDTTPAGLPVKLAGHGPQLRLLTRGGERAPESETATNPRAASVRIRAAERIRESA